MILAGMFSNRLGIVWRLLWDLLESLVICLGSLWDCLCARLCTSRYSNYKLNRLRVGELERGGKFVQLQACMTPLLACRVASEQGSELWEGVLRAVYLLGCWRAGAAHEQVRKLSAEWG